MGTQHSGCPSPRMVGCVLGGSYVRSRCAAEAWSSFWLSFSKCPVKDNLKVNPYCSSWVGLQIPVCHFCLRLVMGYNTMWLSRNHPGQQYNLKKFPLLKLGPSRPVLRNTKYSCLPPPVFVRVEGNLPYRPVLSCGPLPL